MSATPSTLGYQPVLSLKCKLYVGEPGATKDALAVADNEVKTVRKVEVNLTKELTDVTIRGCEWKLQVPTLKEGTFPVELIYLPKNAIFKKLQNSFMKDAVVGLFVADDQGNGLICDAMVSNFSMPQELTSVVIVNAVLNPTLSDRLPEWVESTTTP